MFRLQAATKGIGFRHAWPDNLPSHIYVDEKRLRQILINLLSNAIKYTEHGEAALTVRWRSQTAEFVISDTGFGIPETELERIFEPFERLNNQATANAPGVGLGLTITKVLTTVLGGEITVASEPGKGSAFTVKLMLSQTPPPTEPRVNDHRIAGYEGRKRSILVTDDDPTHLELMREWLQPIGFDLAFARDGAACLDLAERDPPDLVIMDISMPGIDGWEAAKRLRAVHGDRLAILMVSANAHDFSRTRRQDDPHDDFLTKPYEVNDLFERLQLLLDLEWVAATEAGALA
jgi:CheY-like chemotaxis protein/anti-sigma regulatory factor (Ser/Thr protein kinase)